ncbi:hypothetical protein NE237_006227 [Protea cynaroides]|uniref:Ubiquitin-like domain-containing protein n=1 Tax=Protea cynaroides TaxID=273540 RepID=A0A9Q0KLV4_9MAGN|nr:hypothetical protein NE237_006227 [Protea cynaroides]
MLWVQLPSSSIVVQLEGEATTRAIRLAGFVNVPLYVVHVMSIDAMEEIAKAFLPIIEVPWECTFFAQTPAEGDGKEKELKDLNIIQRLELEDLNVIKSFPCQEKTHFSGWVADTTWINVEFLDTGNTLMIQALNSQKIQDIHKNSNLQEGGKQKVYEVTHDGKVLENSKMLSEYAIKSGDTLKFKLKHHLW